MMMAALGVSGCGIAARHEPVPSSAPPSPLATVRPTIGQTRLQVAGALAASGFQLDTPQVPFRPAESPALAAAPRMVYQVLLPDDPTHGFIVVYEFVDPTAAADAGREMAAYLGSGPGRVQFPPDAQHVLRQVGATLVLFSWSDANSPGPDTQKIALALQSIGSGFAIAR
jgi:hypothetical protein